MKQFLRNVKIILVFFIAIFISLLVGLGVQQHRSVTTLMTAAGENKNALRSRYAHAGKIISKDGVVLAQTVDGERVYAEDTQLAQAVLHLVGDYTHNMQNTIESRYQGSLLGTTRNIFSQMLYDFMGKGLNGDDVILTIDSRMSKIAMDLLGGNKGSVVLMNYLTGEVLTAVSAPTTLPEHVINWNADEIPDTALFNRALQGEYNPGSTFKVVTSAAWLQSAAYDPALIVHCDRPNALIPPDGVREAGEGSHGDLDLFQAFVHSCNYFFGTAGVRTGINDLMKQAEKLGYNQALSLGDLSVAAAKMAMPTYSESLLSWMSIGQPQGDNVLTASPLQLCMTAAAVGNNGLLMKPQIIKRKVNALGQTYDALRETSVDVAIDSTYCAELKKIMERNVSSGLQAASTAIDGFNLGGKTGTTETADGHYNSLYISFISNSDYPYCAAIVLEDSQIGAWELIRPLMQSAIELRP